jgi:hypothetical protein
MSANSRYKTHRGREFNMSAFAEKNGDTKVVGNVSMNARGDIIDAKGNVKIPTQTISRMAADLKNGESKHVSLKADDKISAPPAPAPAKEPVVTPQESFNEDLSIVASRDVETENGPAVEVEYSDGSLEIIPKEDI